MEDKTKIVGLLVRMTKETKDRFRVFVAQRKTNMSAYLRDHLEAVLNVGKPEDTDADK